MGCRCMCTVYSRLRLVELLFLLNTDFIKLEDPALWHPLIPTVHKHMRVLLMNTLIRQVMLHTWMITWHKKMYKLLQFNKCKWRYKPLSLYYVLPMYQEYEIKIIIIIIYNEYIYIIYKSLRYLLINPLHKIWLCCLLLVPTIVVDEVSDGLILGVSLHTLHPTTYIWK